MPQDIVPLLTTFHSHTHEKENFNLNTEPTETQLNTCGPNFVRIQHNHPRCSSIIIYISSILKAGSLSQLKYRALSGYLIRNNLKLPDLRFKTTQLYSRPLVHFSSTVTAPYPKCLVSMCQTEQGSTTSKRRSKPIVFAPTDPSAQLSEPDIFEYPAPPKKDHPRILHLNLRSMPIIHPYFHTHSITFPLQSIMHNLSRLLQPLLFTASSTPYIQTLVFLHLPCLPPTHSLLSLNT